MVRRFLQLFLVLLFLVVMPAGAGTQYLTGSPDLTLTVLGVNEFRQGTDITLPVIIKNSGINSGEVVQPSLASSGDPPATAKLMSVSLSPGDAPVIVKTDPQLTGDLAAGASVAVNFSVRIEKNAHGGRYLLPLTLDYTYLHHQDQIGADTVIYSYRNASILLSIPVIVRDEVIANVSRAEPESLNAGGDGYINITVSNAGSLAGRDAVVKVVQNGQSPIIPIDNNVYIGTFPPGATVDVRYKVNVADTAQASDYPVNIVIGYKDAEGRVLESDPVTVGVKVGGKADFHITSPAVTLVKGSSQEIAVQYLNTGDAPIYSAQARISVVEPFRSASETSFLGDIMPGETATAHFTLSADQTATEKEYGLDSEIRFRDALDNRRISDTMKIPISVVPRSGLAIITGSPVIMSIIAAVVIGLVYALYRKKHSP